MLKSIAINEETSNRQGKLHPRVFMLRSHSGKIKYVQLRLPADERMLKLHKKKPTGDVSHCRFLIWMNIYTQLNVYICGCI